MISSGLVCLPSDTVHAAGHGSSSNAAPWSARAVAGIAASLNARDARHHRYQKIERSPLRETGVFLPSLRRQRRDTIPISSPAPDAPDLPQEIPTTSAPNVFNQPQLSPTHARAQQLLANAYSQVFACTRAEAAATLRQIDATLYDAWHNVSRIGEIDWLPGTQQDSPYAIAFGASAFAMRLNDSPDLDDDQALSFAIYHLSHHGVFSPGEDDRYSLYQGVLERGLHWIDPDKVRARSLCATDILQTVYHHRRPEIGGPEALTQILQRERSVLIDEAALIFFHTKADPGGIEPDARIDVIRRVFADALVCEWLDASLGLRLLPSSPVGLGCYRFWYDGKSIPNCHGKSLEQVVSEAFAHPPCDTEGATLETIKHNAGRARHLFGQPEQPVTRESWRGLMQSMGGTPMAQPPYSSSEGTIEIDGWYLGRDQVYRLFEQAMLNLGLDTVYPPGTPHHEMAATLRQFGGAHNVTLAYPNNPAALISAFNRLQAAWQYHPRSPVSPAFLTGLNLARRNKVFLFHTGSALSREQQAIDQTYRDALPALMQAGVDAHADLQYWHRLTRNKAKSDDEIFANIAASPIAERIPIYKNVQKKIQDLCAAPEIIAYADTPDLVVRIHEYFYQHLLAHASPPEFDERRAVRRILRKKLGMTDDELRTKRNVTIGPPSLTNQAMRLLPEEEFQMCSRLTSGSMFRGGARIVPFVEWREARNGAAERIARHPVILAKSEALLRRRAMPYNNTDIALLAELQARNIIHRQNETPPEPPRPLAIGDWLALLDRLFRSPTLASVVEAFGSGDPRQIAELFPFVIPIFDIEEGIRKEDWHRALEGVKRFGMDALFTLAGAGMEAAMARGMARATKAMQLARAATPIAERIGIDSLIGLGAISPALSDSPLATLPQVVQDDPFLVHTDGLASPRQTLPKAIEAGGSSMQPIHHLDVDGQSVIATSSGLGYTEINYRGEPIPGAPPIFTHPGSGEHYKLTKKFGLPKGIAGVTEVELAERSSVAAVTEYWSSIDIAAARVASPAPLDIIRSLVQHNDHPQHAALEKLLVDAYTRSETARVVINHAYNMAPYDRQRCVVIYDAPQAYHRNNRVAFLSAQDLSRNFYTGPTGPVEFQAERMMLHELFHHFTGLTDAPVHEAHNTRGGNILLLQKAINELLDTPPYPPRLTYRQQGTFRFIHHRDGSIHSKSRGLRQLHDWAIAEDLFADQLLDRERQYPDTMYAMGQRITERATVRQGLKLGEHPGLKVHKPDAGEIAHAAALITDSFDMPAAHHRAILRDFLTHSNTFRRLAAAWEENAGHTPVKMAMMPIDTSLSKFAQYRCEAHIISLAVDRIWINPHPLYYFSVTDTTHLSIERRLLDSLLDLFINTLVPDMQDIVLDKMNDRGIAVLLSNAIMQQMEQAQSRYGLEPGRICAKLTADPNAYHPLQSEVRRAGVSEQGFLYNNYGKKRAADEQAEPRRCAVDEERRYSLFSCFGL